MWSIREVKMVYWNGKAKDLNRQIIALLLYQAIINKTRPYAVIKLVENIQN